MQEKDFIELNGKKVSLYTIRNKNGMSIDITNYGARIVSIIAPDRDGNFDNIVLGFDTLEEYFAPEGEYFGATCGRVANRIKNGKFIIDVDELNLAINDAPNTLHGGVEGFHRQVWEVVWVYEHSVAMRYFSKDGEEGFPGNLNVTVIYFLAGDNSLEINYHATTDEATVVNLCNHTYFALQGAGNGTVHHQILQLNADFHTVADEHACPTGEILAVDGTVYDFRTPTVIQTRINAPEFARFGGIDNNWAIRNTQPTNIANAGYLFDKQTGRKIEITTSQPGIQVYTANGIKGMRGKDNKIYDRHGAICLETQGFPAAVNFAHFPSTMLLDALTYNQISEYKFSVEK
ncbi:MAG: galactose mutarotase [Prevotellaceae bacterium]|jgi:aldose 1-epimerase|nr:galactose mutarotase [Prevotellaceae bacterium]